MDIPAESINVANRLVSTSKGNNCIIHHRTCPGFLAAVQVIKIYGQKISNLLGFEKIPSDSITLTPAFFKK